MEKLTNAEMVWDDTDLAFLASIRVDIESMPLERAVQPLEEQESILVLEQRGRCRLSPETRQREEERLAALHRKKRGLRCRKKYTRKRGHVHPKKKERTARIVHAKRWAEQPFGCIIHGYGSHNLDRKQWDLYVAPFWAKYLPSDLSIKKARRNASGKLGTKGNPFTVYSLVLSHSTLGVLFDGASQELYDLSS